MKNSKSQSFLIICCLSSFAFLGRTQVSVIPPVINSVDCVPALELYTGTIISKANSPLDIYIEGEVFYGQSVASLELLAQGRTSVFTIFQPLFVTKQNAEAIFGPIDYEFFNNSLENTYFRTGCLVPGSYEVCLRIKAAGTPGMPSEVIYGEICYDFEIITGTPLLLVYPYDQAKIDFLLPLYTWTPQPNLMAIGGQYRFKIVEILGPQTPYAAFQANPIFFNERGLFNNIFQYPASARPFDPCRQYAWMVDYESMNGDIITSSEIWTFQTPCEGNVFKDKEEDKVYDPPSGNRVYFALSTKDEGNYYKVTDRELRFSVDNAYRQLDALSYSIQDTKGKEVKLKILPTNESAPLNTKKIELSPIVSTGDNQFVIALENAGLKEGEYYTLIINGLKIPYYLRFQFKTNLD